MYRYFLALRYLLSRPINLIGMAGVAVSVWAMIVVVSVFSGFLVEVRAHVQDATADLTVIAMSPPANYERLRPLIERDPNVEASAPRVLSIGLLHAFGKTHEIVPSVDALQEPGAESPLVTLVGIDPAAEQQVTRLREWMGGIEDEDLRVLDLDNPLAAAGERPAILLSKRRLSNEFIKRGNVVKITTADLEGGRMSAEQLKLVEKEFVVSGAYATRHWAFDSFYCFVHIDVLREMMRTGIAEPVTEIVVKCVDSSDNSETAARIDRTVNDELPKYESGIRAVPWQEMNSQILSAVDHQRSLMKLVIFVIMVVAAFLMYATLSMMVTEKTHDIGVLTAMGATRWGVMQVFMSCGLAIVLSGTAFGIVAGCLSSLYLDDINTMLRNAFDIDLFPTRIYNLDRVPYDLDPVWITQVAAIALLLGLLVSGLPAWRAARHDPLDSLRNE